jgi:hypothetical protein
VNKNKTKTKIVVCGREKLNAVLTLKGQKLEQVIIPLPISEAPSHETEEKVPQTSSGK